MVIPLRIVSTDKEAQKAGGLCVALDGQPVLPTDVVDCDKSTSSCRTRRSNRSKESGYIFILRSQGVGFASEGI